MVHRKLTMLAAAVGCAAAMALWAAPGSMAATRLGVAPHLPTGASVVGLLPGATRVNVAVALRPRDPAGLQSFANEVSTPGSSLYGQYLTPAQFAARFGATPSQITEVESSLRAHGLSPGPLSPNGLSIPVSTTAGQLEQAFSTSLVRVALSGSRAAIANTVAPLLDANIPVDGGAGDGPGAGEAALDIEQAIGFAPGANIVVYEGPNSTATGPGSGYYDTWSAIIGQDRGKVVSASWGQCEALEPAGDAQALGVLFAEAAGQGQTVVSASGDEGSEGCNNPPGQRPPDF